jgi:hypothetical protein
VEYKFLAAVALYLFEAFFSGGQNQARDRKAVERSIHPAVVETQAGFDEFEIPAFVMSVPQSHFAGISSPCRSIAEARRSAISDVVRQVLGSIGAEYDYSYVDKVSGNVRGQGPKRVVHERLRSVSRGVVLGVEQRIVESSWFRDSSHKYHYFVLVRYPDTMIQEMRRLSKGAKVVASVVSVNGGDAVLKVSETNGVSVVMSSADVKVNKKYRFSKFISFCVWHVPEGSVHRVSVALDPVKICGGSRKVRLPLSGCDKDFLDYLLGAKLERLVMLKGHDELGRTISAQLIF